MNASVLQAAQYRAAAPAALDVRVLARADGAAFAKAVALARQRTAYISEHTRFKPDGTSCVHGFPLANVRAFFEQADAIVVATLAQEKAAPRPRLRGMALLKLRPDAVSLDFLCSRAAGGGTRLLAAAAQFARGHNKNRLTLAACDYHLDPACSRTLVDFYRSRGLQADGGRDADGNVLMHLRLGGADRPSPAYCSLQAQAQEYQRRAAAAAAAAPDDNSPPAPRQKDSRPAAAVFAYTLRPRHIAIDDRHRIAPTA